MFAAEQAGCTLTLDCLIWCRWIISHEEREQQMVAAELAGEHHFYLMEVQPFSDLRLLEMVQVK